MISNRRFDTRRLAVQPRQVRQVLPAKLYRADVVDGPESQGASFQLPGIDTDIADAGRIVEQNQPLSGHHV
jgi:hypothetical protein